MDNAIPKHGSKKHPSPFAVKDISTCIIAAPVTIWSGVTEAFIACLRLIPLIDSLDNYAHCHNYWVEVNVY